MIKKEGGREKDKEGDRERVKSRYVEDGVVM